MEYTFERSGPVGIFTFNGELSSIHESKLSVILMRAIHSVDRAVLNFRDVSNIDLKCLDLIKNAYCTSLRLKNPIIITDIPARFINDIFNCKCKFQNINNFTYVSGGGLNGN